jgi:hypothetical protein
MKPRGELNRRSVCGVMGFEWWAEGEGRGKREFLGEGQEGCGARQGTAALAGRWRGTERGDWVSIFPGNGDSKHTSASECRKGKAGGHPIGLPAS